MNEFAPTLVNKKCNAPGCVLVARTSKDMLRFLRGPKFSRAGAPSFVDGNYVPVRWLELGEKFVNGVVTLQAACVFVNECEVGW